MDTAAELEPHMPRYLIRVYWRNLYQMVLKNRTALTKEMAGSVPPQAADLWAYAEQMGFNTTLLQRVENGFGILREQTVDEMLHLRIANTILRCRNPETIVLLSGDGRVSKTGTSFPEQLRFALERDWNVEVYSWRVSYNSIRYGQLKTEFPNQVQVCLLDDYYYSLTFVRDGTKFDIDSTGQRVEFNIAGRVVQPLPLE